MKRADFLCIYRKRYEGKVLVPLAGEKSLDAVLADVLSAEGDNVLRFVTEDAGGLILFQHNGGAVHIDFQAVLLCNIQGASQFYRKYNAAQFIYFPNDTGRFHEILPFSFPVGWGVSRPCRKRGGVLTARKIFVRIFYYKDRFCQQFLKDKMQKNARKAGKI